MFQILKGKIYSMIPARAGSKGVPSKNIRLLGGKPLLAWSIETSLRTSLIHRTIVSTDSEQYAEIARSYGAETPFLRPSELANDRSTDLECFKHFLEWFQEYEGGVPEYVVHLRPTTPLRDPFVVEQALLQIIRHPEATALRSAHEMSETAYKCLEIRNGLFKPMGSDSFDMDQANLPRQMFPKTYSPNGYVDVLVSAAYAETGKIHGNHVLPFITDFSNEIDTEEDLARLEYYLQKQNKERCNNGLS